MRPEIRDGGDLGQALSLLPPSKTCGKLLQLIQFSQV